MYKANDSEKDYDMIMNFVERVIEVSADNSREGKIAISNDFLNSIIRNLNMDSASSVLPREPCGELHRCLEYIPMNSPVGKILNKLSEYIDFEKGMRIAETSDDVSMLNFTTDLQSAISESLTMLASIQNDTRLVYEGMMLVGFMNRLVDAQPMSEKFSRWICRMLACQYIHPLYPEVNFSELDADIPDQFVNVDAYKHNRLSSHNRTPGEAGFKTLIYNGLIEECSKIRKLDSSPQAFIYLFARSIRAVYENMYREFKETDPIEQLA